MLRLIIGTAALGLATSTSLGRSLDSDLPEDSKSEVSKNIVGQFQVVGAVCYDENMDGTDEIVITTESKPMPNQRVVMYDDQFDSFPAALASSTCKKQLSFAKKLKVKSTEELVPGWSIAAGGKKTETIKITGREKRQWTVAIINCDENGKGYPVDVDSISITAVKNIPCETLHAPNAGPTVAIVFLTLALLASLVLLILMWKKASAAPKGLTNIDGAGYNEL